jgi:hypothetical protein
MQQARLSVLLLGSHRHHWHADVDAESSYLVNDTLVPAGSINMCKGHFCKDAAMARLCVFLSFFFDICQVAKEHSPSYELALIHVHIGTLRRDSLVVVY